MSNVSYDLDTSGGLMPLIRALIKPPDEEANAQKTKKPQHPYYKRPGKGHNHDSCDACGEGGDLICCDRCPASFHLGCYDPPLDENDIPAGLWLCRECGAADEKPSSSRGSRAQSPVEEKKTEEKKTRMRSTSSQINFLIQYMARHPDLAKGEFTGPLGSTKRKREWATLKTLLKELGPDKSIEQWRHTWRDLKRKAKRDGTDVTVLTTLPTTVPTKLPTYVTENKPTFITRTNDKRKLPLRSKKKSKDSIKEEADEKDTEKEKDGEKHKGKERGKSKDKEEKQLSPMEILVKAAKIMNPRQFELPREMRVPCPFPGTEKEGSKNGNCSVVTVDSSGCVPIPAKSCYVCQGTCKMAPLLQCDYCPLLFHQDCLDPPLTALPTGRWMCPNHVEQYIDWKLVNSISATSRVALWDKFSGPVDQHAIKIDFIRQARKHHPMFRIKVPVTCRGRVSVPDMVRHHYTNPPPLLPSRREYVRCLNVLKNMHPSDYDSSETDEGRKHKVCMNVDCPQYKGEGPCPCDKEDDDIDTDVKAIKDIKTDLDSSDLSDSDFEYLTAVVKRRKVSQSEDKGQRKRGVKVELRADGEAEALLAAVDEQLEKLDGRLVRLLAWQRLQQVLAGEQCRGAWRGAPLSARAEAAVRRSIDRGKLARLGFRHVALPSELLSPAERDRIARTVWGVSGAEVAARPAAATAATPASQSLSDATVRATLSAVQPARKGLGEMLGRAIPMRLSRLSIGADCSCDVVLDAARCTRVSPRHALIFRDEVTGHFELINYSEWGSRVNGVLYGCDLTGSAGQTGGGAVGRGAPAPAATGGAPATREPAEGDEADTARLVGRRIANTPRLNGSLSIHTSPPLPARCECASTLPAVSAAWEGSALVPHSALLQFGCRRYVFTVVEPPPKPPQDDNQDDDD